MYDYLVVGSGLYGAIFAHEAKAPSCTALSLRMRQRHTARACW